MTNMHSPLEQQVRELTALVRQLDQRVNELEKTASHSIISKPPSPKAPEVKPPDEAQLLSSSSSMLQFLSILCFLLVAALGLRALTDNGLLNLQIGTLLGIGYAAGLIISSHFFYRRDSALAPLFSTTGALLMFTILVETYTRFESIPMVAVYTMLAGTGIGLALISYANRVALPIIIGTLGMCIAGVSIDYPNPFFPFLGLLLWTANILGYFATRLKRCSWLRWFLLFTTHFMLQIWGLKVSGKFFQQAENKDFLAADWFIPIVTLIGLTFMMIALFGIIRSGEEKISKFDFSLPALNAGWCYVAGIYAMKNPVAFGAPAAAAAIVHFALAYWLSTRQKRNAPGTNTFVAGGTILACLALPALLGGILAPLPLLAGLALLICTLSRPWMSGGMRVTATLLQVYTVLMLSIDVLNNGIPEAPATTILAAGLCSLFSLAQYRFCRQHKPPPQSHFYSQVDKNDVTSVFILISSLGMAYIVALCTTSVFVSPEQSPSAFIALQSLIINLTAILMILHAARHNNQELRNITILLLFISCGKVILFDLFHSKGIWLVASIFTFGIAAALESFILSRWQPEKKPPRVPLST
ncbi:hypothetical protein [Malonomonas rubra]|uniref:hypothetical protein n=1 Tax=Malonomonas rubra TaxID=57040 RepID=UPI0026EC8B3E|nr:hypothetical protein [Malonomonas rubra]